MSLIKKIFQSFDFRNNKIINAKVDTPTDLKHIANKEYVDGGLVAIDQSKWEVDDKLYTQINFHHNLPTNFLYTGYRAVNGAFANLTYHGYWWTSDVNYFYDLLSPNSLYPVQKQIASQAGMSVRLMRPATGAEMLLSESEIIYDVHIDHEGNNYDGVRVNDKIWFTSNLKTLTYFNLGTPEAIPTLVDNNQWKVATTGAYSVYPVFGKTQAEVIADQGVLYNFYAVSDSRGLFDNTDGWVIPSKLDWEALISYIRGTTEVSVNPTPTKVKPKDDKKVSWENIVEAPEFGGMYEPLDPAIQAHILSRGGNIHEVTAEEANAVRKVDGIVAGTYNSVTINSEGLVVAGEEVPIDPVFINEIKVNGVAQTITDKVVDIEIPTIASNDEAIAGVNDTKIMTAKKVVVSVEEQVKNTNFNSLTTTYKTILGAINELRAFGIAGFQNIATDQEAIAGTDDEKIMTSKKVVVSIEEQVTNKNFNSLTTTYKTILGAINELKSSITDGLTNIASDAEAIAGTDDEKIMTSKKVVTSIDNQVTYTNFELLSTTDKTILGAINELETLIINGLNNIATTNEAISGTNDEKIMTPKKVVDSIDEQVTNTNFAYLSTTDKTILGAINELETMIINGLANIATTNEAITGTDDEKIMTPKKVVDSIDNQVTNKNFSSLSTTNKTILGAINELDTIIGNGNVIEVIKLNGVTQPIADKTVDLTVQTSVVSDGVGITGAGTVESPLALVSRIPMSLSVSKIGANSVPYPTIFKWTSALTISAVELMSNCDEISVSINGTTYNHTTLVGVTLGVGVELTVLDLTIHTGKSNANAIIIF